MYIIFYQKLLGMKRSAENSCVISEGFIYNKFFSKIYYN